MKLPKNDAYLQNTRKSNSKLWFMLTSWKQQAKNINRHVQLCQHLIPFESFCIIQMPDFFLFPKDCTSWQLRDKFHIRSYSGPQFPAFGLETERYGVSFHIQLESGKVQTRITPNTDTFYAVDILQGNLYVRKPCKFINSFYSQSTLSLPPENTRKNPIFSVFYIVICIWMFSYSKA